MVCDTTQVRPYPPTLVPPLKNTLIPQPLSLRPEAHNHSNKRHLSIHDTEEDRLEHETTLDAADFSDAYPQKKKHKHNLLI